MYFLMHHTSDDMPAPSTLKQKMSVLRDISRFSATHQHTLYEAFENPNIVLMYIKQDETEDKSIRLHAVLVQLHRLGKAKTGVEIPLTKLHSPMLERYGDRDDYSQHPPIPTRIYQHLLSACEFQLRLVEEALDDLTNELNKAYDGEPLSKAPSATLAKLLNHFEAELHMNSLGSVMTEIGVLCQDVIIAFTGMRHAEARTLPFDCLKVFHQDGVRHYSIEGIETKLTGGRAKRASWVTSHLAVRAVNVAQKLFGLAHARFGGPKYISSTDGSYLLFGRTGLSGSQYVLERGFSQNITYDANFRRRSLPLITSEDVAELKRIDQFRAWEEEPEFAVGSVWPFTRHQLRRSLSLYAQRSGLVTLPTLKRQLHHITMEMAMYYARNSFFAKNILAQDKKHFAKEWQDTQGLSEYLAYAEQVLFSDERLFGGHVAWAKSDAVTQSPVSIYSRTDTQKKFKKGQLAYKETVLGGCASTNVCKVSPLNWLPLECLESNCKSLIVVPSKLRRVIKAQQHRVQRLESVDSNSVEYRMEKTTLESLLTAEKKITSDKGPRDD